MPFDPALIDALLPALIQQESGGKHFRKGKLTTSPAGAKGVTQVMPATAFDPGYGVKPLADDSEEEYVRFGRDYLGAMLRKFDGDPVRALAAYNAGPGNVESWSGQDLGVGGENIPFKETRGYVKNILANAELAKAQPPAAESNPDEVFIARLAARAKENRPPIDTRDWVSKTADFVQGIPDPKTAWERANLQRDAADPRQKLTDGSPRTDLPQGLRPMDTPRERPQDFLAGLGQDTPATALAHTINPAVVGDDIGQAAGAFFQSLGKMKDDPGVESGFNSALAGAGLAMSLPFSPGRIRAFHASPHDFGPTPKFDYGKLLSGEGNISRGAGFYGWTSPKTGSFYARSFERPGEMVSDPAYDIAVLKSELGTSPGDKSMSDALVRALTEYWTQKHPDAPNVAEIPKVSTNEFTGDIMNLLAKHGQGNMATHLADKLRHLAIADQRPAHTYELSLPEGPWLDWSKGGPGGGGGQAPEVNDLVRKMADRGNYPGAMDFTSYTYPNFGEKLVEKLGNLNAAAAAGIVPKDLLMLRNRLQNRLQGRLRGISATDTQYTNWMDELKQGMDASLSPDIRHLVKMHDLVIGKESPVLATEILRKHGIVGNRVPSQYNRGRSGWNNDFPNYVSFNPEEAKIVNRWQLPFDEFAKEALAGDPRYAKYMERYDTSSYTKPAELDTSSPEMLDLVTQIKTQFGGGPGLIQDLKSLGSGLHPNDLHVPWGDYLDGHFGSKPGTWAPKVKDLVANSAWSFPAEIPLEPVDLGPTPTSLAYEVVAAKKGTAYDLTDPISVALLAKNNPTASPSVLASQAGIAGFGAYDADFVEKVLDILEKDPTYNGKALMPDGADNASAGVQAFADILGGGGPSWAFPSEIPLVDPPIPAKELATIVKNGLIMPDTLAAELLPDLPFVDQNEIVQSWGANMDKHFKSPPGYWATQIHQIISQAKAPK